MPPLKDALESRCFYCGESNPDLLRCSGCKAVMYCNQEDQQADWAKHKAQCSAIKKATRTLEKEETQLRSTPPDIFMPENVFETSVGHFWGIHETRPYMRARFQVAYQLQHLTSRPAVKEALNHFLDMLRLCRGDNMGVRDWVPALYLRLKRDQEAYDFLKWWATEGENSDYDWGDTDLPYLNLKDQDVFEDVGFFKSTYQAAHAIALTLIKVSDHLHFRSYLFIQLQ